MSEINVINETWKLWEAIDGGDHHNRILHIEAETRWPPFLQTALSYALSGMKIIEFQIKFN